MSTWACFSRLNWCLHGPAPVGLIETTHWHTALLIMKCIIHAKARTHTHKLHYYLCSARFMQRHAHTNTALLIMKCIIHAKTRTHTQTALLFVQCTIHAKARTHKHCTINHEVHHSYKVTQRHTLHDKSCSAPCIQRHAHTHCTILCAVHQTCWPM